MRNKIISWLKAVFWAPVKARMQEKIVQKDEEHYTAALKEKGLSEEIIHLVDFVKEKLSARLTSRSISPVVKPKGGLHILYLSPFDGWERANMPAALEKFGKVSYYIPDDHGFKIRAQQYGPNWKEERRQMNKEIHAFVKELHRKEKIDIVISYLSGYHLLPATVEAIGQLGIITTAFWLDDKLKFRGRFDGEVYEGGASVCKAYDLHLTSAWKSVKKYVVEGGLAVFWPEGGTPEHFKPVDLPEKYDVSFIGARYGLRGSYISYLQRHGISVQAFGMGWPAGLLPAGEMINVYAQSKINIGFNGQGYSMKATHLKGRDFEVPLCGAVYLTTHDEDHHRVYKLDEEIFTYRNKKEMLQKVKMLLQDDSLRAAAKEKARRRCMAEHTWENRFQYLFELTGLLQQDDLRNR